MAATTRGRGPYDAYAEALRRIDHARQSGDPTLYLSGLGLTALPPELGQLAALTKLWVHNNQLTALPPELGQLAALTKLYARNNQLTALPPELGQLSALTTLSVSHNQLTALPPEFGQLSALTTLSVFNNQLTALPPELGQLSALTTLDVSNNQLTTLPPELAQLSALTELDVSFNQLTALPPELGQLAALTRLIAHGNHLTALPPELGQLTALTTLFVARNHLTALPPELGRLTALEELEVSRNPLPKLIHALAYDAVEELRAYLRGLSEGTTRPDEIKLVFVGVGMVGKTCLLHVLQGQLPIPGNPSTEGFEVSRAAFTLPHPNEGGRDIHFNAWDFGGQDSYRVTHQFFFSPESLYLVLWNARMDATQCDVEGWLSQIKLRVGVTARAIVVATHTRSTDRAVTLDREDLLTKFGDIIVGFCEVDSFQPDQAEPFDRHGIRALQNVLAREAAVLLDQQEACPTAWVKARDHLLALREKQHLRSLPFADFLREVASSGLDATAARALAFLTDKQGHWMFYHRPNWAGAEQEQELLRSLVILDPQSLGAAIGLVATDDLTTKSSGVLRYGDLPRIWGHERVPFGRETYPFLVQLMERNEVVYRIEGRNELLVAQLVRQDEPQEMPWAPNAERLPTLELVCKFNAHLPAGLVPLLIVRTHRYRAREDLHWTRGTFLAHPTDGQALVRLRDDVRELRLEVRAAYPSAFLHWLQIELESLISKTWPGLQKDAPDGYVLRVPCSTQGCHGTLDLATLWEDHRDGASWVRCESCRQKLTPGKLLVGFDTPGFELQQQLPRTEAKVEGVAGGVAKVERRVARIAPRLDEAVFWSWRAADRSEEGLKAIQAFLAQWDELLTHLADLPATISAELRSRCAEMYRNVARLMTDERRNGPALISLAQGGSNVTSDKYRLTLWCEEPDCPHPISAADGGVIKFSEPKAWLVKAAPFITWAVRVLKVAVPVGGAVVHAGVDATLRAALDETLIVARRCANALPSGELDVGERTRPPVMWVGERSEPDLRVLHELLHKHDPQRRWGGLRLGCTESGELWWLCKEHYDRRFPPPPKLE